MATYYVDSNVVGGTGDGSSWANAYALLSSAIASKVVGDVFLVDYHHTETLATNLSLTFTSQPHGRGCLYRSVDKSASDVYHAGANISTGGTTNEIRLTGIIQGFSFDNSGAANSIAICQGLSTIFQNCAFAKQAATVILQTTNASQPRLEFIDCSFSLGTSYTFAFRCGAGVGLRLIRPTFTGTKGTNATLFDFGSGTGNVQIFVEDADLSGFDNLTRDNTTTQSGCGPTTILRRCILPSSYEIDDAQATTVRKHGTELRLIGCNSGTISVPENMNALYTHEGYAKPDTAHLRTGGASDGTTAKSFELKAVANRTWKQSTRAARTIELVGWVTGGASRTVTIYLAHNGVGSGAAGALTNAECWAEFEGPDTAGSPTAKGYTASSMCVLGGTAAALTTDATSTWTGTGLGTKQQISFTFTPTIAGQVIARVFLAPESASDVTVYVDPKMGIV